MPVPRNLLVSLATSMLMLTASAGQTRPTDSLSAQSMSIQRSAPFERQSPAHPTRDIRNASDSLLAIRRFFSTAIMQRGNQLNQRSVLSLLLEYPQAYTLYQRGQWMKPTGPLLIATGLIISYVAVKGTPETAYVRGIGTPSNPAPPDVLVSYTCRSLPALVGGIGLVVGGLCLIEVANSQTARSIKVYNAKALPQQSVTGIQTLDFGLTPGGSLGFVASL